MAKKIGKVEVAPDVLEPETQTAGHRDQEPPGAPPPRATRFGAGGEGGGGRRERGTARPGFFTRMGQFFRDVRSEMKRVSWPSAKDVKNTTLITLVAVIFFAVYLFAVDHAWAFLLTQLDNVLRKITGAA